VGVAAVRARDFVLFAKNRPASAQPRRGADRTSWPRSRTFCTKPSPGTESSRRLAWRTGGGTLPRRRAQAVPRESSAGGGVRHQLSADGHPGRDCHCAAAVDGPDQINKHVFTAGTFFTFIVAVFKLYDPVRKFALFNNNFQQAVGASSEIFRFMDMEDEVREKPGAKRMGKFARAIRFVDVSFSYEPAEDSPVVLHDINLEVKAARCWRSWARAAPARARWCT